VTSSRTTTQSVVCVFVFGIPDKPIRYDFLKWAKGAPVQVEEHKQASAVATSNVSIKCTWPGLGAHLKILNEWHAKASAWLKFPIKLVLGGALVMLFERRRHSYFLFFIFEPPLSPGKSFTVSPRVPTPSSFTGVNWIRTQKPLDMPFNWAALTCARSSQVSTKFYPNA